MQSTTVLRLTWWCCAMASSLWPDSESKRNAARRVRRFSSVRDLRMESLEKEIREAARLLRSQGADGGTSPAKVTPNSSRISSYKRNALLQELSKKLSICDHK
jgi:hypothetical protein